MSAFFSQLFTNTSNVFSLHCLVDNCWSVNIDAMQIIHTHTHTKTKTTKTKTLFPKPKSENGTSQKMDQRQNANKFGRCPAERLKINTCNMKKIEIRCTKKLPRQWSSKLKNAAFLFGRSLEAVFMEVWMLSVDIVWIAIQESCRVHDNSYFLKSFKF